jgi:DNA-binding Lrp family transcriptional regulator
MKRPSAATTHPADGAAVDSSPDTRMDAVDKCILSLIQSDFPLETRPYAVIGQEAGVSESEALARVRALRARGLIRRIGANFQSAKLGWHSTLCAAKAPEERLEDFIAAVNAQPGVTHNYLRDHALNIWFTCIGPSREAVAETLAAITRATAVPILNLPARRLYKIKVDFRLDADQ